MGLGQVVAGVIVCLLGMVVGGVRVNVGNSGLLPRGLSCGGLWVSPGDEMPVLQLGTPGLLCSQLELNEHHVVSYT